ncbi:MULTISPECIES: universal stress protein [Bythopirellula]|uniref:Universal stress protein E n=2 Tax=Bythopirellula TaxID=1400386 RepID=A0A5C6CP07_9BACT|nr:MULTISPECIES: universal stress protein [Bythopirellula]QEG36324.1 Universal stress protein E [Bythopirellula goksoeyrii]TWU24786.1 Universal stress protein E [Bythopirellula polymerisocia]
MKRFKNILVGIDLSQGDRLVSDVLPPPTVEAVERALWLAKVNSAKVTFFFALDISYPAQNLIEEQSDEDDSVLKEARDALNVLAARAASEGIQADTDVRFGKSWLEIIRQVLREEHDLVVVGTRHLSAIRSVLMGSTGIKLLRKCPCPVWITQPRGSNKIKSILVAHDLSPVGDLAMELGCSMAQLHSAQLHVLHSLESPQLESAFQQRVSADNMLLYRSRAQGHIEEQLKNYELTQVPQVHLVIGSPDLAILAHIEKFGIELLAMGTIARVGIAGFITGNTAENLLPSIPCSVLAVKPSDFVSPVTL